MRTPILRHAAALLICALAAAIAITHLPSSRAFWRDISGATAYPPDGDCFLQQRLSLDAANAIHVRAVFVCY